jgi:antitoxin (DNA-binding transcriptional repressor) of toxin-antitoxin stability system
MYIVHVKRMTASEIRRNWFRVLDEVLAGETVVIERRGRRVILSAEVPGSERTGPRRPDYSRVLRGDLDDADRWSWDWPGDDGEVEPR